MSLSVPHTYSHTAENSNTTSRSCARRTPFFSQKHSFFRLQNFGIQPKLSVNAPDDIYEKEAGAMADRVMRMPDPQIQRQEEEEEEILQMKEYLPAIQRKCEACEAEESLQRQSMEEEEEEVMMKPQFPALQRKCAECEAEEKLQRKSLAENITPFFQRKEVGGAEVNQQTEAFLQSTKGGGQSLPNTTRSWMESRFGADFSRVKIHTDTNAVQLNRDLHAKAFTHGSDIYFNRGGFSPGTNPGKRLLAHELTHVLQQNHEYNQTPRVQRLVRRSRISGCGANNPFGAERRAVQFLNRAIDRVQHAIDSRAADPGNADVVAVRRAAWRAFRFGDNDRTWNRRLPIIRRRMEIARNYMNSVVFQFECCPVGGPCPLSTCGNCQAGEEAATCAGNSTYIALCPLFWAGTRNRNQRARILAHEVFHMNFGFIQDWAQPDFQNAHCYAQFVALLNGFNSLAGFRCH